MFRPRPLLIALMTIFFACASGASGVSGDDEAARALALGKILVDPAKPGTEELCRLKVEVSNHGTETASRFVFAVAIEGQDQPAYHDSVFLDSIAPGESVDLPLFNFWSTEASRSANGDLELEIQLIDARWVTADGEVQKDLGPVSGLPLRAAITVQIR